MAPLIFRLNSYGSDSSANHQHHSHPHHSTTTKKNNEPRRRLFRRHRYHDTASFVYLVRTRQLERILHFLQQPAAAEWLFQDVAAPLHYLLQQKQQHGSPSLPLVQAVASHLRDDETQLDAQGRTALHVAAAHSVSWRVVDYLVANDSQAVRTRDADGRLPLHWACCATQPSPQRWSLGRCGRGDQRRRHEHNRYHTLRCLLRAHPEGTHCVDQTHQRPLFLALQYHAPDSIIQLLQQAMDDTSPDEEAVLPIDAYVRKHEVRCDFQAEDDVSSLGFDERVLHEVKRVAL